MCSRATRPSSACRPARRLRTPATSANLALQRGRPGTGTEPSVSKAFDAKSRSPAVSGFACVLTYLFFRLKKASLPRYCATSSPSSSSMRSSWLYLATRSVRLGAPVLIWPALSATAMSAMSRLGLARTMGDDRGVARAVRHLDSVQGLGQRADLVDLDQDGVGNTQSMPFFRRVVLVTNRSSPTSWILSPSALVSIAQPPNPLRPCRPRGR